ncbi:trafficking protein particle complex subunit 12 isoform X2 [Nematostella vectensis]|nr:trafficking protein particle complex subunit 12 isoform X2 [Nematostella vectensis]
MEEPSSGCTADNTDRLIETVTKIVDEAFKKSHVSKSGKLSAKEFENWLYRTPQIMDNVFGWQCPRPEEGHWMNEQPPHSPTAKIGILESHSPVATSPFSQHLESEPLATRHDLLSGYPDTSDEAHLFGTVPIGGDAFVETPLPIQGQNPQDFLEPVQILSDSFPVDEDSDQFAQDPSLFQARTSVTDLPKTSQDQLQACQNPQDSLQTPQTQSLENPTLVSIHNDNQSSGLQQGAEVVKSEQQYTLQYIQQPYTSPHITPHHLQSVGTTQDAFQTVPATITGIQMVQVSHDPFLGLHPVMKPTFDLHGLDHPKDLQHVSLPTTPEMEVCGKETEEDRRCSAWIPSPQTRQLLATIGSGMMSNMDVDQQFLTSPGIVIDGPQIDPVKDMLQRFISEQAAEKRQVLTVDSVPLDESGLKELLAAQCWRAGLEFTGRFLTAHGQGVGQHGQRAMHTHKTLQMWFCRVAMLIKLQMYSTAEAELDAFKTFDQPDLYYEYYPETYPARKGCMVPFSLRILHAELPQYIGKPNEALDRLYELNRTCTQIIGNLSAGLAEDGSECSRTDEQKKAAIDLWRGRELRVIFSIGNCFLAVKDYNLAVAIFESIKDRDATHSLALNSGIGRIYLQLGDLEQAESFFKAVDANSSGEPEAQGTVVMNKGFMALAKGSYEDAHKHFVAVTKLDPENSVAINNVAVCLLFLGRLKEALSVLETAIWSNPPRNLNDGLLFNLCTIYELESSWSLQKKHKLLELAAQYKGDGFNASCLKIG